MRASTTTAIPIGRRESRDVTAVMQDYFVNVVCSEIRNGLRLSNLIKETTYLLTYLHVFKMCSKVNILQRFSCEKVLKC